MKAKTNRFSWACGSLFLLLLCTDGDENLVLVEVHGPFGVLSRQRMRASANETAGKFRARLSGRLVRSIDFLQGHSGGILLSPGESDWDVIKRPVVSRIAHTTVSSKIGVSLRVPEVSLVYSTKRQQSSKATPGHDEQIKKPAIQHRVHFVTYGDDAYAISRDHLKSTALATGLYHTVTAFTEADKVLSCVMSASH